MPANARGEASTQKQANTRKRNGSITTPEEYQDIKNASDGRKFLEKLILLCPAGEPASNSTIAICLHQISAMAGLSKPAINAIRAAAFLLEELEENAINETIRIAFDNHITEFTADMKLLVEDANTKIDDHIKESIEQVKRTIGTTQPAASQNPTNGQAPTSTYASALINPPPNVNPRIAAREGIKARQFILLGIKDSAFGQYDTQKLKAELNKAIKELGCAEGKIRSLTTQRDGNTLIEVDSDEAAKWFANNTNRIDLCSILGEDVVFRSRIYNILAHNVPLTMEPDNAKHRDEIHETNDLEIGTIVGARWAKPINRRSIEQRTAHLVLSYSSPEAANRAITNGINICNKRCHVERIRREPIRCLKCQGWNHMAKDCQEKDDRCSNCAEKHRTPACPRPKAKRCVSCKNDDHASWSRECPTFLKKVDEYNARNPENLLPFFPTADPWTWSEMKTDSDSFLDRYALKKTDRYSNQQKGKSREQERTCDTYFPNYGRHTPSNLPEWPQSQTHNNPPDRGWWDDMTTGIANNIQKTTQTLPNTQNTRSGPSNARTN